MRLWPFPKKSDVASSHGMCDLPEGVMLALPDEEPAGDATVPTYDRSREGHEPVDPVTRIEQPEESPLFAPIASSGNSPMDEEFNKLFSSNAPQLALPANEGLPSPFLEAPALQEFSAPLQETPQPIAAQPAEPLPLPAPVSSAPVIPPLEIAPVQAAQLEPIVSEIQKPQSQEDPLENLLAQLSKSAPPAPNPIDLSAFNDEPLAPPTAPKAVESEATADNWGLAPTENPPLSSDWSLVGNLPTPSSPTEGFGVPSLSDLEPEPDFHQPPCEDLGLLSDELGPPPSLIDISGPAQPEVIASQAISNFEIPVQPSAPISNPQPPVSRGSMLDTLIPPPSVGQNESIYSPPIVPAAEFTPETAGFDAIPSWETEAAATDFDDFGMISAATEEWTASAQSFESFDLGSNTEAAYSSAQQPTEEYTLEAPSAMDEFALPEASAQTLSFDELEIEEDEDSWSEDDLISESANLNSSDAAYDMNHYDDPDEPIQAISLDEERESPEQLQAMAEMLSHLKPEVTAQPHSPAAQYEQPAYEQASSPLDSLFDDEYEEPGATYATECAAQPNPEPVHAAQEANHTVYAEAQEAEEDDMLKLKGNKAAPEQSILEAISAKFIARPKQDTPNTKAVQDSPEPLPTYQAPPQAPVEDHADEVMIDPAGLLGQLPASKFKPPSLSQAMSNFEEEMLLKETRFVRQSINNLVDRYFAQQEQDHSC